MEILEISDTNESSGSDFVPDSPKIVSTTKSKRKDFKKDRELKELKQQLNKDSKNSSLTKVEPSTNKAAKKVTKTKKQNKSKIDSEKKILEFAEKTNVPFSHTNAADANKGLMPKTKMPIFLEEMAKKGLLEMKTFNKAKIFYLPQKQFEQITNEDIVQIIRKADDNQRSLSSLKSTIEKLKNQIQTLKSEMRDLEIEVALKKSNELIRNKKELIKNLTEINLNNKKTMSSKDIANLKNKILKCEKLLINRKKLAIRIAETVMGEETTKSTKQFLINLGCEVDDI
ncbi:hypothetical protein MHBO_001047 [Bonamia ostreae]|uniref:Homologous-pairing protein 2 winged helix domain-containing protein n=1 Tax=Bonamia ostreae TaxID=126728 RepID=A0ABV2AIB9_9EUKA